MSILELKDLGANLKVLAPAAAVVGLDIKTPLDKETLSRGFVGVSRDFPEFVESVSDKEDKWVLRNDAADYREETLFRVVTAGRRVEFMWGLESEWTFSDQGRRLVDSVERGFGLEPAMLALLDIQFHFRGEWAGNHYAAIHAAFYEKSSLGSIFDAHKTLQNDIVLRGLTDDHCVAAVGVSSSNVDREVRNNKFLNKDLKAYIGIARLRDISRQDSLGESFLAHAEYASHFCAERFVKLVLKPLDDVILRHRDVDALRHRDVDAPRDRGI